MVQRKNLFSYIDYPNWQNWIYSIISFYNSTCLTLLSSLHGHEVNYKSSIFKMNMLSKYSSKCVSSPKSFSSPSKSFPQHHFASCHEDSCRENAESLKIFLKCYQKDGSKCWKWTHSLIHQCSLPIITLCCCTCYNRVL